MGTRPSLDIVIPTYNRADLLHRTLQSIAAAEKPDDLQLRVVVVNNNSDDHTQTIVEQFAARAGIPVHHLVETKQGRSHALNAGIDFSDADLIGMIDDDEEIAGDWIKIAADCFTGRPELAFIGGPYRGNWSQEPPRWLPAEFSPAIGVLDAGSAVADYDESFPGIPPGGNAVIRREWLQRAGGYNPAVGRTGTRLLGAEDLDMYRRLTALGARGEYRPDLIIYHYIPPERLTRRYYRKWAWSHGISLGTLNRSEPECVPRIAGIPRYRIRQSLEAACRFAFLPHRRFTTPHRSFADELRLRQFLGFVAAHWLPQP